MKQEDSASSKDKTAGDHRSDPGPGAFEGFVGSVPSSSDKKAGGSGHSHSGSAGVCVVGRSFALRHCCFQVAVPLRFGGGSVSCGARCMKDK